MQPSYLTIEYKNVTWFIHKTWLVLAAFILGVSVSAIIKIYTVKDYKYVQKKIQQKLKSDEKNLEDSRNITQKLDELKKIGSSIQRGGSSENCIEPGKVYKIIHPQLKIIILEMYKQFKGNPILFIIPQAFILALYVAFKPVNIIRINGFGALIEIARPVLEEVGLVLVTGLAVGIVFTEIALAIITSIGVLAVILAAGIYLKARDGKELVQIQPTDVFEEQVYNYANQREIAPGTIYVKGNSD